MRYSRREFAALTLAGLPAPFLLPNARLSALAAIESMINGVQIGAITYSFRTIPNAQDILKAYQTIGLGVAGDPPPDPTSTQGVHESSTLFAAARGSMNSRSKVSSVGSSSGSAVRFTFAFQRASRRR